MMEDRGNPHDRIDKLEQAVTDLQRQLHEIQIKYIALRGAVANLIPDLLAAQGVTPEFLASDRERLVSNAHWSTVTGATPKQSDELTAALGEEIGGLYDALAKNLAAVIAARPTTLPLTMANDPMAEEIVSFGVKLTDDQLSSVAFIIRREVAAAIESETRALLNLCEREARWTADNLTAKLVLQRVESFAKSRLSPPRPSFFDSFR